MKNSKCGDKLLIQAKRDKITLKPAGKSVAASLAGSIKISKNKKRPDFYFRKNGKN